MKLKKLKPSNISIKIITTIINNKLLTFLVILFLIWIFGVFESEDQAKPIENSVKAIDDAKKISGFAKVSDGDSIVIGGAKIRLLDIDAPEFIQKCLNTNNHEYFCGQESTKFLKKISDGRIITCYYKEKDVYDRLLGRCFIEGNNISINEAMISNGMAIIYSPFEASQALKDLEHSAKLKKLGVWQGSFVEPSQYRKSQKNKNK